MHSLRDPNSSNISIKTCLEDRFLSCSFYAFVFCSSAVPARCLYYFTLISLVNMRKKTHQRSDWDIIKITDDIGNTKISLTCRGRRKDFVIFR